MAVKRALVFKAGGNGPICAAYEVAIEQGSRGREGTIRLVRQCTNATTVVWRNTGFCADCHDVIKRTSDIRVVRRIERN